MKDKQAKTTTPIVPLYDWNDDNEEITAVSGVETKEDDFHETETTEKSGAETEEKTPTEDPQQSFYPWESPVCKDKSDDCESFKHMCSLFRYRTIFLITSPFHSVSISVSVKCFR